MGLFKRKRTTVTWDEMEAQLTAAVNAFSRQLRDGEQLTDCAMLGYPQLPDGHGGLAVAPLALAVVTDMVLAFADPRTGEKHIEYPLVQLDGFLNRADGQFMLRFEATPELVQMCAFAPLEVSDVPPMITASAANGFVIGLVDQWKAKTGQEFQNALAQ